MAKPQVRIAWPDGISSAITVDVTNDVLGEVECWRGRSYTNPKYRATGVGAAGHARFYLRNVNNKYTFDDDKLPIGRRVRIQLQVGANSWRTMWTGYIDTFDYQYRRHGYDRVEVSALGSISQLETATWSIEGTTPDPRAYDVINTIIEGVTELGVENSPSYNRDGNRMLEPPGGDTAEGVRDWSVRLQNFRLDQAPALQSVRDAATMSFAHVYETVSGRLRIDGLPNRQSIINGTSKMTFRDTNGTGVRVHSYDIALRTDRVANAAARSIAERFEAVDNTVRSFANGDGQRTLKSGGTVGERTETENVYLYPPTVTTSRHFPGFTYPGTTRYYNDNGRNPQTYIYPANITISVHFTPQAHIVEDPNGVLAPTLVTPPPYTETIRYHNDWDLNGTEPITERHVANRNVGFSILYFEEDRNMVGHAFAYFPQYPATTDSNSARATSPKGPSPLPNDGQSRHIPGALFNVYGLGARGARDYGWERATRIPIKVTIEEDAPSDVTWRWEMEYQPFMATETDQAIGQNDTSITRYGRRGYAIPGIFWGPDLAEEGATDIIDIRSFVGYIVRDEFLGQPGYYGSIVVDLTSQYYPTSGATNPELDVGDKITLIQGTNSRDYLVSAIRYRFRQGEQLRAQIECAPARVM